jgi:hypothetical protein
MAVLPGSGQVAQELAEALGLGEQVRKITRLEIVADGSPLVRVNVEMLIVDLETTARVRTVLERYRLAPLDG